MSAGIGPAVRTARVRHDADVRTDGASRLTRWSAGTMLAFVVIVGVAPPSAGAQEPPASASVPAARRGPACSVEVVVEIGSPPPSTTLPGTCLLSAASGIFAGPEPGAAGADALPATGSATGATSAIAAIALVAGSVLWLVARRPRAT